MDETARDQEDYKQLLLIRAWEADERFLERDGKPNSRDRWVSVAVRNRMIEYTRARVRVLAVEPSPAPDPTPSCEGRTLALDALAKLRSMICPSEWDLLVQYMEHGCQYRETWQGAELAGKFPSFRKRIQRAKRRARECLETLESRGAVFLSPL